MKTATACSVDFANTVSGRIAFEFLKCLHCPGAEAENLGISKVFECECE